MRSFILAIAISLAAIAMPGLALADAGITISPPFQNLSLIKSQPEASFSYTITNNDVRQTKSFAISAVDFGSLNQSGGLVFLATTPGQIHKYGLINWLSVSPTTLSLSPGQTGKIQATVHNSDSLVPGGHYGAILATQLTDNKGANSQVVIQPVVSTLLFVSKLGGEKYGLTLSDLKRGNNWWQSLSLHLTFKNSGNIDVVPRGVIQLLSPNGKEVARAAINEDSARILPETTREFTSSLTNTGPLSAPGKYKLSVLYRYDGRASFTSYTQSFYYFTFWGIVLTLGTLLLLALAARWAWIWRRKRKSKAMRP